MDIFLHNLKRPGDAAYSAADGLREMAETNKTLVIKHIKEVVANLDCPNYEAREALIGALAKLGTAESIDYAINYIKECSIKDLAREVALHSHGGGVMQALMGCIDDNDIDKHLCDTIIEFAIEVTLDEDKYPPHTRSTAMLYLTFCTNDHDGRGHYLFPRSAVKAAESLAIHYDEEVASEAINFLTHIQCRLLPEPEKESSPRIDVSKDSIRSILRQHGRSRFADVDPLDFEHIISQIFSDAGYRTLVTDPSGDYGADVIAEKNGERIAIQVKRYGSQKAVGVADVYPVRSAMNSYKCSKCMIITTSRYTDQAKKVGKDNGVILWGWDSLFKFIRKVYS